MDNIKSTDSLGEIPTIGNDYLEVQYDATTFPTLVTRIKAVFIDILVMLIIFTATTLFIDAFGDIPNFVKGFILIFMLYLYDPILTAFTGSTLGHKMMKLTVRTYSDPGKKITLGQAFLRFITKAALGWISFLTVTGNKRKRAIHDLISGSIILKLK